MRPVVNFFRAVNRVAWHSATPSSFEHNTSVQIAACAAEMSRILASREEAKAHMANGGDDTDRRLVDEIDCGVRLAHHMFGNLFATHLSLNDNRRWTRLVAMLEASYLTSNGVHESPIHTYLVNKPPVVFTHTAGGKVTMEPTHLPVVSHPTPTAASGVSIADVAKTVVWHGEPCIVAVSADRRIRTLPMVAAENRVLMGLHIANAFKIPQDNLHNVGIFCGAEMRPFSTVLVLPVLNALLPHYE